ncbi:DUF7660 family protein [Streptomyces gulbargensis]|uniref:DUF7660 family protein n=1 Tax=Streptomyces gulbargensis TaxID=364901 RepID=UPI003CD0B23B
MSPTTDGEVRSRDELVSFVQELHRDFLRNGHEWENQTLGSFLEALATLTGLVPECRERSSRRRRLDLHGQSVAGRHGL